MSFIATDANGLRNGGDCLTMHDNAKEVIVNTRFMNTWG